VQIHAVKPMTPDEYLADLDTLEKALDGAERSAAVWRAVALLGWCGWAATLLAWAVL
jgi:hypothetical protein